MNGRNIIWRQRLPAIDTRHLSREAVPTCLIDILNGPPIVAQEVPITATAPLACLAPSQRIGWTACCFDPLATNVRSRWHFRRSWTGLLMAFIGDYSAGFQDQLQPPHIGDVLKRIGLDHNQVGELTHLDLCPVRPQRRTVRQRGVWPQPAFATALRRRGPTAPSRAVRLP